MTNSDGNVNHLIPDSRWLCAGWFLSVLLIGTASAAPPHPVSGVPRSWSESNGYVPSNDVEGSGLAIDDDGVLYLLSEGHGVLLRFADASDSTPKVIPLQIPDSRRNKGKGGFDLEAMCIVGDEVYVCDEHTLRIYVCGKSDGRLLEEISILGDIDQSPTGTRRPDGSWIDGSQKSIEGLVVRVDTKTRQRHFFLLDEHDEISVAGKPFYVSRLYEGSLPLKNGLATSPVEADMDVSRAASFELGRNEYERFTELLLHDGQLYAIRSVRKPAGYSIVRLRFGDDRQSPSFHEIAKWGLAAPEYSSNFEGAAISSNGQLMVCTDGPGFRKGSWRRPQPVTYKTLLANYGKITD